MSKLSIVDRAAAFLAKNKEVTPTELNDHLAVGNYAGKYVLYMRIAGYDVSTVKDGRTVLRYVYNGPGTSGKDPLTFGAVPTPAATAKSKSTKSKAAPVVNKMTKPKTQPVVKAAAKIAAKKIDLVEQEFGTTGSVGTIDADWDSVDGIDIKQLV